MNESLNTVVKQATKGNKKALEQVVVGIKDMVYNLSFKMLLSHDDAKDATQEILIKVVTHLSTFNHKSKFTTWVYRVATNYLLNTKIKKSKEMVLSYEDYEKFVDMGQSDQVLYTENEGEIALLEEDIRIGCTQGLLLCLNESDRLVYILGMILEFNSVEGSELIGITPENYRKKLSRSKAKIKNFMSKKCGVVNPDNPCRCKRHIDSLIDTKRMDPNHLQFAISSSTPLELSNRLSALQRTMALYRSTPNYPAPQIVINEIKEAVNLY